MSDEWIIFPSTRTANQAFIFFDHGLREQIDQLSQRFVVRCVVKLKSPTEEGLPANEEFDSLMSLEDELVGRVADSGCVYVGRITAEGSRQFIFYSGGDAAALETLARQVGEQTTYEISASTSPDPDRRVYWDELFPTEPDWRVINDMQVIEALEEHGDDQSVEREIQHWVYFPHRELKDAFIPWATAAGYAVEETEKENDSDEYGLVLSHLCKPDLITISSFTLELLEEAKAHGGKYDGWETFVIRPDNAGETATH